MRSWCKKKTGLLPSRQRILKPSPHKPKSIYVSHYLRSQRPRAGTGAAKLVKWLNNGLDKKSRPALGSTGRLRNERWGLFARLGSQVHLETSLRMCGALTPNPHTLTRLLRPVFYRVCHRTSRKTLDVDSNIQTEMCGIQVLCLHLKHCSSGHFSKRRASLTRNFQTTQS